MSVEYPNDLVEKVDQALDGFLPSEEIYPQVLYKAMRYSLFAGGKRFRPVLVLSSALTFDADVEAPMPTACAIEYIHTYSLIHDDLPPVDDDDYRRGRPTCHKVFGVDIAIMAGDALFAEAFSLVARLQKAGSSSKILAVIRELAEASGPGGMVGGQVVDMISTDDQVDLETVTFIHTHKTGRLIKAAVRSGAILAGASSNELELVSLYADHLGLAFQITDDILDEVGTLDELGKAPGADKKQHKVTFPLVMGMEEAKKTAEEEIKKAKMTLEDIRRDTGRLERLADFVITRSS
jgi:geranylgeranyl diphosphate synthase type II